MEERIGDRTKQERKLPIRNLSHGIGTGYVYFIYTVHTENADRFY